MCGDEEPNSTSWAGTEVTLDQVVFLKTFRRKVTIHGVTYHVVPINHMRVLIGRRQTAQLCRCTETDHDQAAG